MKFPPRRWILAFIGLTVFFYGTALATIMFGYSIGMSTFDTGEPTPVLAEILVTTHVVLTFPLSPLLHPALRSVCELDAPQFLITTLSHLIILANAALWAGLLTALGRWVFSGHRKSSL